MTATGVTPSPLALIRGDLRHLVPDLATRIAQARERPVDEVSGDLARVVWAYPYYLQGEVVGSLDDIWRSA